MKKLLLFLTWPATVMVIGTSRIPVSLSKYSPASSGNDCLKNINKDLQGVVMFQQKSYDSN